MNLKKEIDHVAFWLEAQFANANKDKAIVGLSGGIDSAVAAELCVKALGKDRVLGVIMPLGNNIKDEVDAKKAIRKLGINYVTIELEESFEWYWGDFVACHEVDGFNVGEDDELQMVRANAKARFRMTTLYAISEMQNGLVVGTTNKSEGSIGYATKFGDHGVDLEPLLQFYKHEIFDMAKLLDVPKDIIDRSPSAGLWDGQTDEDELGMSYEKLDYILKYINGEIDFCEHAQEDVNAIKKRIKSNLHKTVMPPCFERN